jgi:hypothetical protein
MEVFKVHTASDDRIVLKSDKQMESLFKEIEGDQNFIVEWVENNIKKTKLFLGDGLLSRLKDGRLVIEAREDLNEDDPEYDEDAEEEEE